MLIIINIIINWTEPNSIQVNSTHLNSAHLSSTQLSSTLLDSTAQQLISTQQLNSTKLNSTHELNWTELNWTTQLNWINYPPKTGCGCLRGEVIENGLTRNSLTLWAVPVRTCTYICMHGRRCTFWVTFIVQLRKATTTTTIQSTEIAQLNTPTFLRKGC